MVHSDVSDGGVSMIGFVWPLPDWRFGLALDDHITLDVCLTVLENMHIVCVRVAYVLI
jgi:hypothetical protein